MSGVLGGGTQNGTWLAGAFHVGYWKRDRIRYIETPDRTYVNIVYYGSGIIESLEDESVNLNLDAWLLLQQIKFRVAETNFFIGDRYLLLDTENTFEIPVDIPEFEGTEFSSTLSEATAVFNYDSRHNDFSPNKGFFIELSGTYSDTWMGSDDLYGRLSARLIGYFPVNDKLMVGVRHERHTPLGISRFMPFRLWLYGVYH